MLKKIISSSPLVSAPEPEPPAYEPVEEYSANIGHNPVTPSYSSSYLETPVSHSRKSSPQMSKNILSSDVEIKGSIKFTDELILDGSVEGEITSDAGHLTVGENARVKGEVKTRGVVVYGKVDGNITVTERCELKTDAEIVGDIKAGTLSIEEGAAFMGQSQVGNAASNRGKSPSKPSAA